ncbi:hypothetical protein NK8_53360 (plasmid) [Caballeronia sp. NK8]|nr:hypothetical protein NK8_53360 [Caballeronia sp. NK8]
MAAEREEIVVTSDAFEPEQLGPQLGERGFGSTLRRFERAQRERIGLRIGQRAAIELAARRQRQRIERDEGRRHHVVGQTRGKMLAQGAGIDIGMQRDIGDELLILRTLMARPRNDHRFTHRRVAFDLRLDLTRLDAKAANLDLMIVTAEKLDIAIEPITREIARAVHAATGNERVIEEALGGEFRSIQIAARHARATDMKLADRARRHHATLRIEHIGARVGKRLADHRLGLFGRDLGDGRIDCAFGRTIDVEGAKLSGARQSVPGLRRERLAAHENRQSRLPPFEQTSGKQRFELSRRAVEYVDASGIEEIDQRHRIGAYVGGDDHQPMSGQQGGEVLHRRVERDARVQRDAGVRRTMSEYRRLQGVMQVQHMTMLDQHALRFAGRTGCIDRIGKMMRGESGHERIALRQRVIE